MIRKFTIDGHRLAYLDRGKGDVILFLHSYFLDLNMWSAQIDRLSQNYRCITCDLWGHGCSDYAPNTTHDLQGVAADLLALMDSLHIENFSVVGASVGGMIAAELAVMAKARVSAMALVGSFVGSEVTEDQQKYYRMIEQCSQDRGLSSELIQILLPSFFSPLTQHVAPELIEDMAVRLSAIRGQDVDEMIQFGLMIFDRRDLLDELPQLDVPTLLLVGEVDQVRPPYQSQLMHEKLPRSELVILPKTGHYPNIEHPHFVSKLLQEFFIACTQPATLATQFGVAAPDEVILAGS